MTKKQVRSLKKGGKTGAQHTMAEKSALNKKPAMAQGTAQDKDKESLLTRFIQFLKDVRVEFDKVSWANRKETITLTIATMVFTFFVASYLGLVDILLSKLVGILIN